MGREMAGRFVVCLFCGFEFEPEDTLCRHGCPMRTNCGLIRCPGCDYEFPERPAAVSWLGRLLRLGSPREPACGHYQSLEDVEIGVQVEVSSLPPGDSRRNTLAVFGLVPETRITLLQKRPACVVKVGETELALDPEIASEIIVRRPTAPASRSLS